MYLIIGRLLPFASHKACQARQTDGQKLIDVSTHRCICYVMHDTSTSDWIHMKPDASLRRSDISSLRRGPLFVAGHSDRCEDRHMKGVTWISIKSVDAWCLLSHARSHRIQASIKWKRLMLKWNTGLHDHVESRLTLGHGNEEPGGWNSNTTTWVLR